MIDVRISEYAFISFRQIVDKIKIISLPAQAGPHMCAEHWEILIRALSTYKESG